MCLKAKGQEVTFFVTALIRKDLAAGIQRKRAGCSARSEGGHNSLWLSAWGTHAVRVGFGAQGAGRITLGAGRYGRWALGAGRWALGAGRWALGAWGSKPCPGSVQCRDLIAFNSPFMENFPASAR
jgi:hypothetical protein